MNSIYFLDEWSQRHTLNASFAPQTGHFSLPFVGGMSFNISSNTGLSNYIYKNDNELVTFMHPSVDGHDFIDQLATNNFLHQASKVNLLSFGFYNKENYWSFDFNLKEQLNLNLPVDLFRLIKLGFEHETNQYDLKDLSIDQSNIAEYSLGYSRNINQKIRIGANMKLLIGLSSEQIKYSKFDVLLTNDRYQINATGETNIMSDILTFGSDTNNNIDFFNPDINFSSKNPAGTGGAIDLGITYKPNLKWTFSGAVNDLGIMFWNASKITKGIANSNFIFTGFTVVDMENNSIESQLNQMEQDLNNLILFQDQGLTTSDIVESTPTSVNLSAEYSVFGDSDRDIKLGVLLNSYNSAIYNSNQLMGAVTFKPMSWLSLSTSYSILFNESNRFGIAMNFSPEWLNAFIAADFSTLKFNRQFIPINKFNLNFQAGISLYLGE
ncbi:MAG: DUF5723 family protein [Paludibacter sp.]|nr:DUF5723 family protein [Paludibacter sp.]